MLANLDANDKMARVARPGHFNDADLLQVGNAGLSPDEARSHFAAWAVVAAPLLISNDLVSGVDAATLDILTAPEVIQVSQDALGVQGVRVSAPDGEPGEQHDGYRVLGQAFFQSRCRFFMGNRADDEAIKANNSVIDHRNPCLARS
jgi:hypothetical protein